MEYHREPVKVPTLSGFSLRVFVELLESPLGGLLCGKMTSDSGLGRFRSTSAGEAPPLEVPFPDPEDGPAESSSPRQLAASAVRGAQPAQGDFAPETVTQFAKAYRQESTTPVEVARRVVEGIERFDRGPERMGLFIATLESDLMAQAEASQRRHQAGEALSVLDGVPVAVKDEMDQMPFGTTLGTSFLNTPAKQDATAVARLREAGALLIGKANMQEVGINPIGINPHYGASRNPNDRTRITGGSSSGPAAAVAAGLCPISIGADGGGSIRIPASLCGVVGFKATWGRISEHGVAPLCWHVGHVGPLAATVRDLAVAYAIVAGPDPKDASSLKQPPVHLCGLENADLSGLRLGIHRPFFEDADRTVVDGCQQAVDALVAAGAKVVDFPAPDLNTILWSHATIILSEMLSCLAEHHQAGRRRFGLDTRTNLAIASHFTSRDFCHALRHRHRLTQEYLELMQEVDLVVTPTTATTAPPIPEHALPTGQSDLKTVDALMRFIRVGNLTGFPAIAVPAGYDSSGLPISCQLLGRPWQESLLLRAALVAEQVHRPRKPKHHAFLLGEA